MAGTSRKLVLYADPSSPTLNVSEIAEFIRSEIPSIEVEVRQDVFTHFRGTYDPERVARRLASIRITDPVTGALNDDPLPLEVEYELRRVLNPSLRCHGVLYDGYELMALLRDMIPPLEMSRDVLHLVFTGRLVGTRELGEDRVHARVVILGNPAIASTSGAVEAPARPREYYLSRLTTANPLLQELLVSTGKASGGWDWLEHDDPRLTEVMKGYALQAVFYFFLGEAFCDDADCRLFNAHRQSELIRAQLLSGKLCNKHRVMLEGFLRSSLR